MNKSAKSIASLFLDYTESDTFSMWQVLIEEAENLQVVCKQVKFAHFLSNPKLSSEERKNLGIYLAEKIGVGPSLKELLSILAEEKKTELFPAIIQEMKKLLFTRFGVKEGEIIAATKLSPAQEKQAIEIMKKCSGAQVITEIFEDPKLIGGLILKIDDMVIDLSLKGKLKKLKKYVSSYS